MPDNTSAPMLTEDQVNEMIERAVQRALASREQTPVEPSRVTTESLRADDIGYFNPKAEDKDLQGKHIIYNDVYAFTDRLLMFAKDFTDARVHKIAPACLRGPALEWHSHELTSIEREFYTMSTMARFCDSLIARFKVQTSTALHSLQSEKFTMADLRAGRTLRSHTQRMLRFAKAAEVPTQMQLLTIWNSLDANMQLHILEPTQDTKLSDFLTQLDSHEKVFQNLNKQRDNQRTQVSNKPTSKSSLPSDWDRDRQSRFPRNDSRPPYAGGFGTWQGNGARTGYRVKYSMPANYSQTTY
jgi:hypothetical protein